NSPPPLEIYPPPPYSPILGYGNMARKMGLHYSRVDVAQQDSHGDGAVVPVAQLERVVVQMIEGIRGKPTCVLPMVVQDPFLESVL
ncbi:hypothetical protein B484DRAFT_396763, partial [Ochromonadaceae sp. CCMP2298]